MGRKIENDISRRTFLKGTAAGITFLTVSGVPAFLRAQQPPIRIGAVIPLSGNYGFLGASERCGIGIALDEFNSKGGLLGRKIEVLEEDCATDAALAIRKAQRLLQTEKVDFFVNGGGSSPSAAMADFAKKEGVIDMCIDPNSDILTGEKANRYFFMIPVLNYQIAHTIAPYVAQNIGKKWYYFTHDYSWGWTLTESCRKFMKEKGAQEVGESKIPLNTRDYSSFLLKVRSAKPEVLMVNVAGVDFTSLVEQINEFGLHKSVKIVVPLEDFEDAWAVGPEKNAVFTLMGVEWHYAIPGVSGIKEFVEKYKKLYPRAPYPCPTTNSYNTYIGVRELLRAVDRTGTLEAPKVIKALEGWTFKDSLKNDPTTIREWDHQFVQDFYYFRPKKKRDMKDWTDIFEYVGYGKGSENAITKDLSQAKMEKLPGE
jgi:branched-chain amino acid transport system substrate-binding protein